MWGALEMKRLNRYLRKIFQGKAGFPGIPFLQDGRRCDRPPATINLAIPPSKGEHDPGPTEMPRGFSAAKMSNVSPAPRQRRPGQSFQNPKLLPAEDHFRATAHDLGFAEIALSTMAACSTVGRAWLAKAIAGCGDLDHKVTVRSITVLIRVLTWIGTSPRAGHTRGDGHLWVAALAVMSLEALIEVGRLAFDDPVSAEAAVKKIPRQYFRRLGECRWSAFRCLKDNRFDNALATVRALALAERIEHCPFHGSTSLLIPAYAACSHRTADEVATIADWIVAHHDNPYTPFNFRRTRAYWEAARVDSPSPTETWRRVRTMEASASREKARRAARHEVRVALQRLQRGTSPSSDALRERIVEELEREMEGR